jgi:hypothetical protein
MKIVRYCIVPAVFILVMGLGVLLFASQLEGFLL